MDNAALLAITPLDGRYYDKVAIARPIFSEYGLIKFRLIVEIRWLELLAGNMPEFPALSSQAKKSLQEIIDNFSEQDAMRVKQIEAGINHDVKAIEYFIKQKMNDHKELAPCAEFIHFGCTSEDINNLAYGLMLLTAKMQCLLPAYEQLLSQLKTMSHDYADLPMLARTHGQPATPTTVGKEIANFVARLQRQVDNLVEVEIYGKFNGATGNYNAVQVADHTLDWQQLSKRLITQFGLTWNPYTTQIEPHDGMSQFFDTVARINTILIDLTRDIWGYIAINYFKQKTLANEVGSSTMPHKVNPIDFENAEGNLGVANALLKFMSEKLPISRWQRDLSDSTVLRNIGVALTHALIAYQSTLKGLKKLEPNKEVLARDLDSHWEVLGEAIQTVMRRYNIPEPYEKLKAFTRGRSISKEMLQQFIAELAIPQAEKERLLTLTPATYLGYASDLAKRI